MAPSGESTHLLSSGGSSGSDYTSRDFEKQLGESVAGRVSGSDKSGYEDARKGEEDEQYFLGVIPMYYITGTKKPRNGTYETTFLLISSMIGSGILSQPYCFMQAGIVMAMLLYLLVGAGIYLSCYLLIASTTKAVERYEEDISTFEYVDLSRCALGDGGKYVTEVFITLGQFSALVSYVVVMGILMSQSIMTLTDTEPENEFTRVITRPSVDVTIVFLLLVIPNPNPHSNPDPNTSINLNPNPNTNTNFN